MASQKTDKCCYESRFGGNWITREQFLAENMVARAARAQKTELPNKFWNDPYWLKKYKLQIKHVSELLKDFTVAEIIKGLKHPDARQVYSFGLKSVLVPLIRREQKLHTLRVANQNQELEIKNLESDEGSVADDIPPAYSSPAQPRKPFSVKKNKLQQLRELES